MQNRKDSLIIGGAVIAVIMIVTGVAYIKFYRPIIQDIITYKESLEKLDKEMQEIQKGSKELQVLTETELTSWRETQAKIYRKFPPPEVFPKYLTFKNSTNIFYGDGASLQQQVPQLFLELAQAMLSAGVTELNLVDVSQPKAKLTIPSKAPEIKPLELDESSIMITFSGGFRQIGEFLRQLDSLPRFVKVSSLVARSDKAGLKISVTVITYHCQKGVLGNVPA